MSGQIRLSTLNGKETNMSNMEIKQATINEYRWLKRLALASENYFLAEYYDQLIKEETEK